MTKILNVHDTPTPIGTIISQCKTSAPSGFLYCNGTAISRSTYSALFAEVGTAFGTGDGSTTFNLPDLRGRFLRGQDDSQGNDPDAGSRLASASGGNTGDNVGSLQSDGNKQHNHGVNDLGHSHSANWGWQYAGYPGGNGLRSFADNDSTAGNRNVNNNTTGITIQNDGESETRPKNINVRYYIKY